LGHRQSLRAHTNASGSERVSDRTRIRDRASQPVELGHHQRVALPHRSYYVRQRVSSQACKPASDLPISAATATAGRYLGEDLKELIGSLSHAEVRTAGKVPRRCSRRDRIGPRPVTSIRGQVRASYSPSGHSHTPSGHSHLRFPTAAAQISAWSCSGHSGTGTFQDDAIAARLRRHGTGGSYRSRLTSSRAGDNQSVPVFDPPDAALGQKRDRLNLIATLGGSIAPRGTYGLRSKIVSSAPARRARPRDAGDGS
jgi:hypothetical protein